MQQLVHERAMFAPIWDLAFLHGVGPRVEESGLGLLGAYGLSITLTARSSFLSKIA
jgi:peptide/nickel transport system substrate-binding protein